MAIGREPRGPGRGRRRASRGGAKKRENELLDAAATMFHRQGYADTTMQDVADALGILKGSLYYYIDSKDDLLYRLLRETTDNAQELIEAAKATDGSAVERLHAYVYQHVLYNARNIRRVSVYYHDFDLLSEERRAELVRIRSGHERFVRALIEEAQRDGDIPGDVDSWLAVKCFFAAANWIYRWYAPDGRTTPEALAEYISGFCVDGLRTTKRLVDK